MGGWVCGDDSPTPIVHSLDDSVEKAGTRVKRWGRRSTRNPRMLPYELFATQQAVGLIQENHARRRGGWQCLRQLPRHLGADIVMPFCCMEAVMDCCGLWRCLLERRLIRVSVLEGGRALVFGVTRAPAPQRCMYCACRLPGCPLGPAFHLEAQSHALSPAELEQVLRERCPDAAARYDRDHAAALKLMKTGRTRAGKEGAELAVDGELAEMLAAADDAAPVSSISSSDFDADGGVRPPRLRAPRQRPAAAAAAESLSGDVSGEAAAEAVREAAAAARREGGRRIQPRRVYTP
eukprot:gene259-4763_t